MSAFFEAFNPAARHWREQQDLEKVLVVDTEKGSGGPRPLDLDSGVVHLVMPRRPAPTPTPQPARRQRPEGPGEAAAPA